MDPTDYAFMRSLGVDDPRGRDSRQMAEDLVRSLGMGTMAYLPVTALQGMSHIPALAYGQLGTIMPDEEIQQLIREVGAKQGTKVPRTLTATKAKGWADAYDIGKNRVELDSGNMRRGVVAHELGHASRPGKYKWFPHQAGKGLAMMSLFPAAFTGDQEAREALGALGSAAMLPTLYEEIMASRAGSKILKNKGVKGIRRFSPFIGVPTYAAMTTLPLLTAKVRTWLDDFMNKDKQFPAG